MRVCLIIRYYRFINDRSTPLPGTSVIQNKHFVPLTLKYLEVTVDVNNLILWIDRLI